MKYYTDLLIDIDGTLLDTQNVERYALKELFDKHHLRLTDHIIDVYSKINEDLWLEFEKGNITKKLLRIKRFELLFNKFQIECDADVFAKEYFELYSKTAFPYDGAIETIHELNKNYKLHIISNGSTDVQYYKLNKMAIKNCFDSIFLSEEIGYVKPDTKFFEYVHNNISQKDKKRVLVIGDSLTADIEGGKSFGFDTALISKEKNAVADYTLSTFE